MPPSFIACRRETPSYKCAFSIGVINVVTGTHANAASIGKAMCDSPAVKALSFTGSTRVGTVQKMRLNWLQWTVIYFDCRKAALQAVCQHREEALA